MMLAMKMSKTYYGSGRLEDHLPLDNGNTVLHLAVSVPWPHVRPIVRGCALERWITSRNCGTEMIGARNDDGDTPLHLAAQNGYINA